MIYDLIGLRHLVVGQRINRDKENTGSYCGDRAEQWIIRAV